MAGLHGRLTLISAPAGFGKTSLASAWIAGSGRPAAWLSLDDGDNDPARFLAHLVAALQKVVPKIGAGVAARSQASRSDCSPLNAGLRLHQLRTPERVSRSWWTKRHFATCRVRSRSPMLG